MAIRTRRTLQEFNKKRGSTERDELVFVDFLRMDSFPTTSRLKQENGINIQRLEQMFAARWTYVQRGLRFQHHAAVTATLP